MVNRDFLKLILSGHKRLMPMKDVRFIHVPKYDELAVEKMMIFVKTNADFISYFPDNLPKGRQVSRDYFWNILNTLDAAYVAYIVAHANKARFSVVTKAD